MLIAGGMFLTYAIISLIAQGTLLSAISFLSLVAAFGFGYELKRHTSIWIAFAWACVAIFPIAWYIDYNPNIVGCFVVLALAGCGTILYPWPVPFLLYILLWSQSRGALIAFGIGAGLWLARRFPVTALTIFVFSCLIAVTIFDRGVSSLWQRLGVWQDTLNGLTLFGLGWGNYAEWYHNLPRQRNWVGDVAYAYNDLLDLIWAFGIGTCALWAFIVLAWRGSDPGAKFILLVFGALGLTYFPLSIPILGHMAAFTLGHLALSAKESYVSPALNHQRI